MTNRRQISVHRACARAAVLCLITLAIPASAQVLQPLQQSAQALATYPLASYPGGAAMLQQALGNLKLDVKFAFLNKDYENDQYVREPITGKKVRTACVRFKASSGFWFKVDPLQHSLTTQGLTISQNVAKIRADGLAFKFMIGPCAWVGAGLGLQLTDVKFVYKAKPMLALDREGSCRLVWNNDPNSLSVAIGDLNIIGVQNDLDKLAKDATREALNATFDAMLGSALRGELQEVVIGTCGSPKNR